MNKQEQQMTPAPYAAGTGSVPVTPDRAAFDRMGYRERLALKRENPCVSGIEEVGGHPPAAEGSRPLPTMRPKMRQLSKRRKFYV